MPTPKEIELAELRATIARLQASGITEKQIGDRRIKYADLSALIARATTLEQQVAIESRRITRNIPVRFGC